MSSLHTPSHLTSTRWKLIGLLYDMEASASSVENLTKMGEFISIVSCNSEPNSSHETQDVSMLAVAIQTFEKCIVHQRRVMIMQLRMVTLSEGPSNGRAEVEWVRLALGGLRLSQARLEKSFLRLAHAWIQSRFVAALWGLPNTPTGNTEWTEHLTVRPGEYLLSLNLCQRSLIGYEEIWKEINPVSDACGWPEQTIVLAIFCGIELLSPPNAPSPASYLLGGVPRGKVEIMLTYVRTPDESLLIR